jgi:arsenate reductase-like glutaredoxin family protein
VTHDCPCCIQCKRSQHSTCQDVEKIEEVVKTVNLSEEFISLNSKIGDSLKILEKLSKDRDKNMLKLRSQREDLYKQLKINRDLIDKALNEFEADTKC